jgi:hypothetical protein
MFETEVKINSAALKAHQLSGSEPVKVIEVTATTSD